MMFPLAITVFMLMCTYFVINIYLNKGVMTDTHFYIALIILTVILVYIITWRKPETFAEPLTAKERNKIINTKNFYKETKETLSRLKETANQVRKSITIVYPKVVAFSKELVKCVKEAAVKTKLTEKFLSLS